VARLKAAVLISGRGSNLAALIDACAAPDFPAQIALVLSNRADAAGLAHAARAGIPARVVAHRDYASREAFDAALDTVLAEAGIALVCLAGFMRLLGDAFVARWRDRMINIHPSLLPAFRGLDTHARALAAGVRFHGCTVHFVRPAMDDGPIIVQAAVPVLPGDDPDRLAARVLAAEHRAYPLALRLVAEGRARVEGERVVIAAAAGAAPPTMLNPPDAREGGPMLTASEPQLFVTDLKAACDFFTGRLGFAVAFLYGDPPFYGQVQRDAARLNLRHVDAPVVDRARAARDDLLAAAITVDDVARLFREFEAAGVAFHRTLHTEPWGARTFIVADPDGNLVLFAGAAGA
jgi:phosphoribosylglycinamide formyltransferase-1